MARQKLGQHFLFKGSILERIAAAACAAREDLVIEIGPGRGALTEKLLKRANRVIAIELDYELAEDLRRKFAGDSRLEVIHADVLQTDLGQLPGGAQGAPIAGNLPYYITSPILEWTARFHPPRAVYLMQKEVAERLIAQPGTRAYGYLTVSTRLFADAKLLFEVPPSSFHPPPKVDSAVVLLQPHTRGFGIEDRDGFLRFVGACFHQKRKTLRNNLAPVYGDGIADAWPEAGLRAEQITLEGFVEMYRRIGGGGDSAESS